MDADTLREIGVSGRPSPESPPPVEPPASVPDGSVMSLVDHLGELRTRLFRSILAVVVGGLVGFAVSEQAVTILSAPLPTDGPLLFTGLGDAFAIRLKIALVIGIVLAMPVLLFQAWRFIAPGLTEQERRMVRPWIPLSLFFFALGIAIAYIVLPYAARFLIDFATADLQPMITVAPYFDFVTTMFLAFGLVLQFPIVLFGLSRVGIASSARLASWRRYAVLVMFAFAAILTPGGDLVSPVIMTITMYTLFELTILFIRRSGK
jgi:sec-independent protein translocase protein TatC